MAEIVKGFMIITVLTAIFILLADVGLFGSEVRQSSFTDWGNKFVLGEIIIATVIVFKWEILSTKSILFVFDPKSPSFEGVNPDECLYEITDENAKKVDGPKKAKIVIDRTSGRWKCDIPIPSNIKHNYVVTMTIIDDKENKHSLGNNYILQQNMEI